MPGETELSFNNNYIVKVRVMVFNATFNIISIISWRYVLLVKETGVLRTISWWEQVTF
jgi:hypothetical protein